MNDWKDYMPADALVTAEDARAFVASFGNNAYTGDVLREMDAKMARDRRRACRRGALDSWRAVRDFVTWARAKDEP